MTVRITSYVQGGRTIIRVEGKLTAIDTSVLVAKCRSAGFPQRLDLSGLQSADRAGIAALRSLQSEGAEFHGTSPYIRRLLEEKYGGNHD
jgi:ABC-type transporter Mla MlaB component